MAPLHTTYRIHVGLGGWAGKLVDDGKVAHKQVGAVDKARLIDACRGPAWEEGGGGHAASCHASTFHAAICPHGSLIHIAVQIRQYEYY